MTDKEKAIDKLEKAQVLISNADSTAKHKISYDEIRDDLQDAMIIFQDVLALLREPKCKTCGGSGEVPQKSSGCSCVYCLAGLDGCQIKIPCPACQPKAELTKEAIKARKEQAKRLQANPFHFLTLLDTLRAELDKLRSITHGDSSIAIIEGLETELAEKDKRIEGLEKLPRCPCGAELEGLGYEQVTHNEVWQCKVCQSQIIIEPPKPSKKNGGCLGDEEG